MKNELRDKFTKNGIPYNEIDKEMISIIDVLNFQLGYKTKFCCYGHSKYEMPSIMFGEEVTDDMIYKLIEHLHDSKIFHLNKNCITYGTFNKWARYINDGKIILNEETGEFQFTGQDVLISNWMWEGCLPAENFKNEKKTFIENFYKCLLDFIV